MESAVVATDGYTYEKGEVQGWFKKHLVFCDSMPAIGAAQKGRSPHFPALRLCRRLASLALGVGVRLVMRYVWSEKNWGDGPSRGSKAASIVWRCHL